MLAITKLQSLWAKWNQFNLSNFHFVQVYLGGSQFTLNYTETEQINQPKNIFYFYANIPCSVVALVVNIWAIIIIRKKEKTGIHNLIICDCIANVLSMTYGTFK